MKALVVYYTDPVEGRQKLVIANPSPIEVEHYLWVAKHIHSVPDGRSVGLFGARMVIPVKTLKRDWLLNRDGIGTIRVEDLDEQAALWAA